MTIQDMAAALAARDAGMQSSAEHADDVIPGWQDRAVTACISAIDRQTGHFTMEHIRAVATWCLDLPQPPELRAWGSLTIRLIREGIIEKTGQYAPAASSHGSAKPLYRRKGIK